MKKVIRNIETYVHWPEVEEIVQNRPVFPVVKIILRKIRDLLIVCKKF